MNYWIPRFSIRLKFALLFALVSSLPLLVIAVILAFRWQANQLDHVLNSSQQIAKIARERISSSIAEKFVVLNDIGSIHHPQFPLDPSLRKAFIKRILFRMDDFIEITLLDSAGQEISKESILRAITPEELVNRAESKEFQSIFNEGIYLGPVYISHGQPLFDIGRAIIDPDGVFRGGVLAHVDARKLQDAVIKTSELTQQGRVYIVDQTGIVRAHSDLGLVLAEKDFSAFLPLQSLGRDDAAASLESYRNQNEEEVAAIFSRVTLEFSEMRKPLKTDWFLVVEQLESIIFAPVRQVIVFAAIAFFILLMLTIAATWLLVKNITQPILALHSASERFGGGDFDYRVQVRTRDELEDLAKEFNSMAAKIKTSITELKEREILISAERNKFAVVVSGISDAIIAFDAEQRVVFWSKSAEKLLGIKEGDARGKLLDELFEIYLGDKKFSFPELCPPALEIEEGIIFNQQGLRAKAISGKEIFVDLTSAKIKEGRDVHLGCIFTLHNVTKEMILERLKTEFVSVAAHQLRTPLSGIKWSLKSFLSGDFGKLSNLQSDFLKQTYESNERMITLVNDLLDVAKIEEGRFLHRPAPINLRNLVAESMVEFKTLVKRKGIELIFKDSNQELPEVFADNKAIKIVLNNLFENALNYTLTGGKIWVDVKRVDSNLVVSIRDTGIGIPEGDREKVFTKFYRGEKATKMETEGSGFGLFVAKNIIEVHGGKIWFETEDGRGSTFSFSLPIFSNGVKKS